MNRLIKTVISIALCLSVLLSLVSCDTPSGSDKVSDGYTGGFSSLAKYHMGLEIHWFETYDEVTEVIELLENNGSTFRKKAISSYENDVVDAKYCLRFSTRNADKLKEGRDYFDRKIEDVSVSYFGFIDDVSIEELEYSFVDRYKHIYLSSNERALDEYFSQGNVSSRCEIYQTEDGKNAACCRLYSSSDAYYVSEILYNKIDDHVNELPDNFHEEFAKSIVVIGDIVL